VRQSLLLKDIVKLCSMCPEKNKCRLVVFIGTVGGGKTTAMEAVYSLLSRLKRVFKLQHKTYIGLLAEFTELLDGSLRLYSKFFNLFVLIDVLVWFVLAIFLFFILKVCYVLSEDYLLGAISDYLYIAHTYLKKPINNRILKLALKLLFHARPNCIIYLYASMPESYRRQLKRGNSHLENEKYLIIQPRLSLLLARIMKEYFGVKVILINTERIELKREVELILRDCPLGASK